MNKNLQITFGIAVVVLLGFIAFKNVPQFLGSSAADFWTSATNTTSTVTTVPALVIARDAGRSYVSACTTDTNAVFLCFQTATSTCATKAGYRLSGIGATTSTFSTCWESETYKGDIVMVSEGVTTTVSIVK